jgi:hypothetical protein
MVPQEILVKLNSTNDTDDPNEHPEFRYLHKTAHSIEKY